MAQSRRCLRQGDVILAVERCEAQDIGEDKSVDGNVGCNHRIGLRNSQAFFCRKSIQMKSRQYFVGSRIDRVETLRDFQISTAMGEAVERSKVNLHHRNNLSVFPFFARRHEFRIRMMNLPWIPFVVWENGLMRRTGNNGRLAITMTSGLAIATVIDDQSSDESMEA